MTTRRLYFAIPLLAVLLYGSESTSAALPQAPTPKPSPPKTTTPRAKPDAKPQPPPAPAPERQPASLSPEDVIQLVQTGLPEDVVIAKIRKAGKPFDLSAAQLLQLKKAGVSDNIIRVLMDPQAQLTPPTPAPVAVAPQPQSTTPVNPPPAPVGSPTAASPEGQPTAVAVPDEQGLYWLKGGKELVRMEGMAVSNIRTGSTLVSGLTGGIKRARVNAQLKGARSETRIKERLPQFYLYLPEGVNAGDYLLLRLAQRLDVRQIEIGQQTFWKKQVGVDQAKQLEFSFKRIRTRLYLVTPNHELEPGEYGFYTTAGGVSVIELKKESARVYDFGIDP